MGKNEKSCQQNTKRLGLRHALLASTALFLMGSPALGQVEWEGDVDGRWTESGNWSSGSVPTDADEVIIDAPVPVGLFVTVINGEVGEAHSVI